LISRYSAFLNNRQIYKQLPGYLRELFAYPGKQICWPMRNLYGLIPGFNSIKRCTVVPTSLAMAYKVSPALTSQNTPEGHGGGAGIQIICPTRSRLGSTPGLSFFIASIVLLIEEAIKKNVSPGLISQYLPVAQGGN
jgi:hypothetical protein